MKLSHAMADQWPIDSLPVRLGKGVLSINFDDFPRTAWTEGGPVLASLGVKATYFIAGGLRNHVFDGIREFDVADLEAAFAAGHEIGCHSYNHFAATRCAPDRFLLSVEQNQRFVAEVLPSHRMESFCFPYGAATTHLRRRLKERFTSLRGTLQASNGPVLDRSLLRAFGLEQLRFPKRGDAERHLGPVFAAAARDRRWVVVFTHDVTDRPTAWGCTPDQLHEVVSLALEHGLDVATNAEVMRRLLRGEAERTPPPGEALPRL